MAYAHKNRAFSLAGAELLYHHGRGLRLVRGCRLALRKQQLDANPNLSKVLYFDIGIMDE